MSSFCKNEDCPPSQRLLAYQTGEIEMVEARAVRSHLSVCEFCEAEVAFYAHYPPTEETVESAEIPEPLYELAAALMKDKRNEAAKRFSSEIDRIFQDSE